MRVVLAAVAAVMILAGCSSPEPGPDAATPTASSSDGSGFGDGTYLVGTDIEAGTYRAEGGEYCHWERLSGTSGDAAEIIAQDNPDGPVIVTVKRGDVAFSVEECGTLTPVD